AVYGRIVAVRHADIRRAGARLGRADRRAVLPARPGPRPDRRASPTLMRPTLFVPIVIYLLICTVPLTLGIKLLVAPGRTGNFLHDAFIVFPAVEPSEAGKRRFYRALGLILVGVSLGVLYSAYVRVLPLVHGS